MPYVTGMRLSEDNPRSDHGGLSSNRLYPLIGRSLVSEKESGSCYSDDRFRSMVNKNSKRYKNKSWTVWMVFGCWLRSHEVGRDCFRNQRIT